MQLKAAVVQLRSTMDVGRNQAQIARYTTQAAEAGADIIVLPENAAFVRTEASGTTPIEPLDGPLVQHMRELAGRLGVWLVLGSYPEQSPDPARYYNTSVVIDGTRPEAPVTATYRKLHLFDIDIAGGESQRESDYIVAGDEISVTKIAGVRTGLSICYDLRFPGLYQALADAGAQLITCPAAFTEFTGKDHWLALLKARAIETQTYVLAPNQFGHHGGKRRSYGKSAIFDPWGTPLCVAPDRPGWVMAVLDFEYLRRVRASLPRLEHRHPAILAAATSNQQSTLTTDDQS